MSPEGIGDITQAGHTSGYAHLAGRGVPTVGRLVAAARTASAALVRPTLWPRRRDHWQPAPRAARRGVTGRMKVTAAVLEPNGFTAVPADGAHRPAVLRLAHGRAHLVAVADGGEMLAIQELAPGRTRVLGSGDGYRLINTGTEPAVVVRVTV
ncbi:hypothetical protein ACFO4E_18485 [Nocardiopsis mangrovi]|uniref:Uncharacterized protein n=1 Tax=Nocardiopsis mangrovi TaxID=1179818 RepID=A0ABV9DY74_9ACTN